MSNSLRKITLSALSGVALLVPLASAADASVVTMQISAEGGPPSTFRSGTDIGFATGIFGAFSANTISAIAAPASLPDLLDSTSLNIANLAGNHTLVVSITAQGLTAPLGVSDFTSTFTENALTAGWSVTEQTLISPTNALFTGNPLSTATFGSIGTSVQSALGNAGAGPLYSLTEV